MRKLVIALILLAMGGGIMGLWLFNQAREPAPLATTPKRLERPYPVETVKVTLRDISETISLLGTVEAMKKVTVSSKTAGVIEEVGADVGQAVEEGKPLVKIEDELLKLELAEATERLSESRANLEKMRSYSRPEEIKAKQAALASALARFRNAQEEWARMSKLHREGIVARERLDAAETALKVYQAELDAAREQLALIEAGARKEDQEMAQARVKQAEALIAQAAKRLADTRIASPMAGYVSKRYVEPGERVVPGSPLFDLLELSQVKVMADLPEKDYSKARTGSPAAVQIDAFAGKEFVGRITRIHPQADLKSRTFPIEVVVPNKENLLRPGLVARVSLTSISYAKAIALPREAISEADGRPTVHLVKEGRARRRPVEIGERLDELVIVNSGLSPGDEVVVGPEGIPDGVPVEPVRSR